MPKLKPKTPSSPAPDGAANKFERFTPRVVSRAQVQGAPYNPRQISPAARKALRDKFESTGQVEPLIWNKRTGNLVGGHQRLTILDDLMGTDDYKLTVSEVDLSPADEKVMNVFLNNPSVQGTFTQFGMAGLLADSDFTSGGGLLAAGFTPFDFEMEFGSRPETLLGMPLPKPDPEDTGSGEDVGDGGDAPEEFTQADAQKAGMLGVSPGAEEWRNTAAEIKRRKAEWEATSSADPKNDSSYVLVVSFNDREDKNRFLEHNGMRLDLRYLGADDLENMVIEECKWRPNLNPEQEQADAEE